MFEIVDIIGQRRSGKSNSYFFPVLAWAAECLVCHVCQVDVQVVGCQDGEQLVGVVRPDCLSIIMFVGFPHR